MAPRFVVLLWLSLLVSAGWAEPLTWYSLDLPPLYIASGPDAGQGQLDRLNAFLRDRLPGYEHRQERASIPRILQEFQKPGLVVLSGVQKTPEREAIATFSAPFMVTLPPLLYVRVADADDLAPLRDAQGAVSLDDWLKTRSLGLVAGRSYAAPVDDLLAHRADPTRLIRRFSATEVVGGLTAMLVSGRVDGILSFRAEVASLADAPIVGIPLRNIPDRIPLYIAASRNPAGAGLIRKINQILKENWTSAEMRAWDRYPAPDFVKEFVARGYPGP